MDNYCIVSFCNIYLTPYAKLYIENLQANGNAVTLLYWDRDAVNGDNDNFPNCKKVSYQKRINGSSGQIDKLFGYIGATDFFRKHLETNQYSGLIMLQTHVAVACESILRKKYSNRYIVDIRDYSLEKLRGYYYLEKRVIDKSFATVISSPAYSKFLPKHDYYLCHNYSPYNIDLIKEVREESRTNCDPIKICFIGSVRFYETDKQLITLFANDERFKICYYGLGSEVLQDFCNENKITNVDFYGSFQPEMTPQFYKKTNIINNVYGNHNPYLDYALSNKLYYAAQFQIPILVCKDTYMQDVVSKYNLGFVLDLKSEDATNELYRWFNQLNRLALADGAEEFLNDVNNDMNSFYELLHQFANDGDD